MKKVVLLSLLSSFVFAGNVKFSDATTSTHSHVKSYIVKTLNEKCSAAFDDGEASVTVTSIQEEIIDQGMEREYTATIEVVADYGHSGSETITLQFDEDVYHGAGFWFYRLEATKEYLCK